MSSSETHLTPVSVVGRQMALLVVIHVRDAAVSMETAALHRYLRQADGRVTLLQVRLPGHSGSQNVCDL